MSLRLPRVTAVELLRALRHDGWLQVRQHGSHVILKHPIKTGRVVVPNTYEQDTEAANISVYFGGG